MMQTLWQDLRYGARMLRKQSGFTLIAVLTLALGIGANTAIFGIFSGVLLRPLPFPDAQRLVVLQGRSWMPVAQFTPHVGRDLRVEEAQPGRQRVALVSAGLWQRQFGNAQLNNQTVRLNGDEYQVVGVLPQSFQPFELNLRKPEVWVPHALTPIHADGELNHVIPVARLKADVTLAQAQAELDLKLAQLKQQRPELFSAPQREVRLGALQEQIVSGTRPALRLLLAPAVGA